MRKTLLTIALTLAAGHASACFTVYDANGRVLYHEPEPPVDMSKPLREALSKKFSPEAHLVFDLAAACREVQPGEMARPAGRHVPENTVEWRGKLVSDPQSKHGI